MTFNQTLKNKWTQFFLVTLISFISIFGINRLNIKSSIEGGAKLRLETTVKTADDVSYLLPAKNYLNNTGWNDGTLGIQSNYMRSPGYGVFCLPFFAIFKEATALSLIRTTQCISMALVAGTLFMLLLHWGFPKQLAFVSSAFLGIVPSFSGYVFYTLTEGISPALIFLLFALYAFSRQKNHRAEKRGTTLIFLFACVVFGFLFITRPVYGTFALLLLSIFFKIKAPLVRKALLSILGLILAFGPTVLWEHRNLKLGKEITGISTFYEIYSPSNNSIWRAPHQSIYELVKLFSISGQDYHEWSKKHETAAQLNHEWEDIQFPLSIFDDNSIALIGQDTLTKYVHIYQQSISEIAVYAAQNKYSAKEELVAQKFDEFTRQYKEEHTFRSWVITPLKVLKSIVWQSHLNLFLFWNTYGQSSWIKLFSLFTSLLNFAIYFLPFCYLLVNPKTIRKHLWLILSISLNIAYLIFVQRGLEQRYYSPLLPVLFACSLWIFYRALLSVRKIIQRQKFP
ncbi:MAG: hypothetical protein ACJA0Q_001336 [Saprospiraceae bacterium]|jgi:hypothetical protein